MLKPQEIINEINGILNEMIEASVFLDSISRLNEMKEHSNKNELEHLETEATIISETAHDIHMYAEMLSHHVYLLKQDKDLIF